MDDTDDQRFELGFDWKDGGPVTDPVCCFPNERTASMMLSMFIRDRPGSICPQILSDFECYMVVRCLT